MSGRGHAASREQICTKACVARRRWPHWSGGCDRLLRRHAWAQVGSGADQGRSLLVVLHLRARSLPNAQKVHHGGEQSSWERRKTHSNPGHPGPWVSNVAEHIPVGRRHRQDIGRSARRPLCSTLIGQHMHWITACAHAREAGQRALSGH